MLAVLSSTYLVSLGTDSDEHHRTGLGQFIRTSLRLSYSTLTYKYAVHELVLAADNSSAGIAVADHDLHPNEIAGDQILPDADQIWRLFHADGVAVSATFIEHRVPTLGFVLDEDEKPGRLRIEAIRPILELHRVAFADRLSVRNPMALLASFKAGTPITLPDGTVLQPSSFVDGTKRGRKIVILGDTNDPSAIASIAGDADVLVHEATNAYLEQDAAAGTTSSEVRQLCISHGHSTPEMAGEFARRIGARTLILNHFSSRYRGDEAPESRAIMEEIRQLAVAAFGCDRVVTASDLLSIEVVRADSSSESSALFVQNTSSNGNENGSVLFETKGV